METAFVSEERFTRDQFHAWAESLPADDRNRYELLDGRIAATPLPGWPHSRLAMRIASRLLPHVEANRLGEVLESSAGYDLPSGDCVQPDLSFFSTATLQHGPRPVEGKSLAFAPDLVVEVLSPSTRRRDLTEKRAIYERNGVAEYWVVDPPARRVVIFVREDGTSGDGPPGFAPGIGWESGPAPSRLFPGIGLSIEQIFA